MSVTVALTLVLRAFQLVCAVAVLILSVLLVRGYGGHATLFSYGSLCGLAALIVASIGVVTFFLDAVQGMIVLVADGVASFILIAGATAFSAKLRSGRCTDRFYLSSIAKTLFREVEVPPLYNSHLSRRVTLDWSYVERRCQQAQADEAFLWILTVCFVATAVLGFLSHGKSWKKGGLKY